MNRIFFALVALLMPCAPLAVTAQNPVTLAADGAWTWFNDPRAIFKDGKLYFGYMRFADGKSVLGLYDPQTEAASTTLWTSSWTEKDDHNNPALLPLQDGRMMGFYAQHGLTDKTFNYRLSTSTTPTDPVNWGAEQTYTSAERISYANPYQLSAESGRIYNFFRNLNYNPTFVTSDDFGTSWSTAKILIQTGTGGAVRPYVKYNSNGNNRVDFLYTDDHPRDEDNSLYHGYYANGSLYKTDGTFLKTLANAPLLHDSGERGSVIYQYSAAPTADPNSHIPTGRAWSWETAYDSGGNPVAAFTVQRDNVTGTGWTHDRIYYYYSRYIPGTGWQKRFIAHAGRPLYESEDDYAGGICIDPGNSNVIYISTNAANPFNLGDTINVPLKANNRYEIYRGVTADGGLTFTWQSVTPNSAVDNLRPYVPANHTNHAIALVWFAGTYNSYTSWNAAVKGLFTNDFNQPPSVSIVNPAGASAVLENGGGTLNLAASVSDDGLPGALTSLWSIVSGPSGATFANAASANTDVTFTQPGQYLLRITASDTSATTTADVNVTVNPVAPPSTLLYSQNFDALANGILAGQAGFTSNPGPVNVEAGGLSYSGGAVSVPGGAKNCTLNSTDENNWALINTFDPQSGTVYFSVAMTWTNQEADDILYFGLSNDADTTPVALGNSGGVFIGNFGGNPGQVGGRIRNDSSVNSTSTSSGVTVGSTTPATQLFVGSLSKVSSTNYNTLKLWINPTGSTEGSANLTITRDMGIAAGLDTFYFFTGAANEINEVLKLDNIRIGLTYSDVTTVNSDSDSDGMTDTWEETYFGVGNLTENAVDDFDDDGTANLTEFRLGLVPNSGTSRFAAALSPGGVISWPSVTGVTFKIWRSTTLQAGSWSDRGNVPGTAGTATFTDPSPPAGTAFYRVALLP